MKIINADWKGEHLCGDGYGSKFPNLVSPFIFYIEPVVNWLLKNNDTNYGEIRKLKPHVPEKIGIVTKHDKS